MTTWGFPSSRAPQHSYELQRIFVMSQHTKCSIDGCYTDTKYKAAYGKIGEYWSVSKILCEEHLEELEPIDIIEAYRIEEDYE